eukprot:15327533-Ditylum_brightwellii.AAC.1
MRLMRGWVSLGGVVGVFGSGFLGGKEMVYRLGYFCKRSSLVKFLFGWSWKVYCGENYGVGGLDVFPDVLCLEGLPIVPVLEAVSNERRSSMEPLMELDY